MSKSEQSAGGAGRLEKRAVALQYGEGSGAPVIVASGMGYLAEKILEVAQDSGVPVYEDNSLASVLSRLNLGQEVPEELYRAIVEIYVYFLNFDPRRGAQTQTGGGPPASGPEDGPKGLNLIKEKEKNR